MSPIPERIFARATVAQLRQRVGPRRASEIRQSFVMAAWARKAGSE